MGWKEIIMIIIAMILAGILALNNAPSISASGAAAKTSVLSSETSSVVAAAKLWMANNSTTGVFTGITPTAMSSTIPNLTVTGGKLVSKINSGITYDVTPMSASGTDDSILVTISGLGAVAGAEAALTTDFNNIYGASTTHVYNEAVNSLTDVGTYDATGGVIKIMIRG